VYGPLPKPKSIDSEAADSDSSSDGWDDVIYELSNLQGDILSNIMPYYNTNTLVKLMNSWGP